MNPTAREQLERQHGAGDWPPSDMPGTIAGAMPGAAEIDGWQVARVNAVEAPGARAAHRALLRPADGDDGVLVRLDLVEDVDWQAARERLLELLGEVQAPNITRQRNLSVGDIAFGPPDLTAVLFARANVVVWLRNAERRLIALGDIARRVDERLLELAAGTD